MPSFPCSENLDSNYYANLAAVKWWLVLLGSAGIRSPERDASHKLSAKLIVR